MAKKTPQLNKFPVQSVRDGYRRLAYGCSNDAYTLILSDSETEAMSVRDLDLFNVSEIKRPKGGGLEIKFYDRMAAMQKLEELEKAEQNEKNLHNLLAEINGK
jgi:hypothetical protein